MCLQLHLSLPAINKSPNLVKVAGSPGTCGIIRELFPYREVFDSHVGGYFALISGINKDKLILQPAGKGTRGKVGQQKTELESLASYHNIGTWSLCRPIWETSMKFLLQNSPIRCSVNWISIHHICHLNLHFSRWESEWQVTDALIFSWILPILGEGSKWILGNFQVWYLCWECRAEPRRGRLTHLHGTFLQYVLFSPGSSGAVRALALALYSMHIFCRLYQDNDLCLSPSQGGKSF